MAYCFERHESIAVGVRRIVGELTWTATNELHPGHPNYQAWVHNTRTCYKKIRSLMRLLRIDLEKQLYQNEQALIRDAGKLLSRLRDAEVLVQACDGLNENYRDEVAQEYFVEIRNALLLRYQRIVQIESNLQQMLLATANELADLPIRCADWPLPESGILALMASFERSYRRGYQAFGDAYRRPDENGFHQWRKRVKDHWYQCRLFDPAWTPAMMGRIAELKGLADVLGEDHDLAVLQQVLVSEADEFDVDASQLADLARERQETLRARAAEIGQNIYASEPEDLTSQLAVSLERWL